ncbi:MAG TPA: sulfatase-like hydrolase/transferase, partial [Turneriella sp.]|nr:sulfatase-like hydrolase/transferase [Turneriella sp.]
MKTLLKIYLLFFLFLFVSHCVFHIAYLDSPASFMAYLVALRYDAATLSFLLGLPALLYLLAWRWVLLRKAVLWVIAFLSHYTFVVLFSDLFYYGLAGKHGTVELQIYFSNYIDTNLMAIREYPLMALGYVLSIVIFFLLWKRRIAVEGITIPHNFARQNLLRKFSIVLLFIFVHIVAFRGGGQGRPLRPANAFEALTQAEGDFALNGVYTTSYALFHRTSFPVRGSPESIQNARKFIQAKGDVFIEDSYPFLRRVIHPKPAQKKNVVFIILESWSGKRVGIFGDTTNATPFFDTLARKGWLFTNAYATGRRSIASLPAAISSIPSLYGTLYITSPFEQNFQRGMGAIFREAGYATHFTYAAKAGSMGFNTFARLAGFETILTRESFPADAPTDGVWGVYDHVMFQRVLSD